MARVTQTLRYEWSEQSIVDTVMNNGTVSLSWYTGFLHVQMGLIANLLSEHIPVTVRESICCSLIKFSQHVTELRSLNLSER